MSNLFKKISNTGRDAVELDITEYFGGIERGMMVQLTQGIGSPANPGFIQFTTKDAYEVIIVLLDWLKKRAEIKKAEYEKEIKKNQELKNTIFQEAIEIEKFIQNLNICEIPLLTLGLLNNKKESKS